VVEEQELSWCSFVRSFVRGLVGFPPAVVCRRVTACVCVFVWVCQPVCLLWVAVAPPCVLWVALAPPCLLRVAVAPPCLLVLRCVRFCVAAVCARQCVKFCSEFAFSEV